MLEILWKKDTMSIPTMVISENLCKTTSELNSSTGIILYDISSLVTLNQNCYSYFPAHIVKLLPDKSGLGPTGKVQVLDFE